MKALPLVLLIILISPGLDAIAIAEIDFNADFEIDKDALTEICQITLAEEYSPEKITAAIQRLYEYFYEAAQYYIRIPLPELIPLSDQEMRLVFNLQMLEDSTQVYVRFTGLKHFSESILYKLTYSSMETAYPLSELPEIMQKVLHVYHQRGYLFAEIKLDSLVIDQHLTAWLHINEGEIVKAQNFHFRGNKISRESSLLKNSGLLGQKQITPQILTQAAENIKNKAYIRDCVIIPLDEENLLIEIEEGRMTFLEGLIGFNEREGKSELSGMLFIEFLNLWGTDRGISLYWRNTPAEYSELMLSYHESGLISIPVAADLKLARTTQDSVWIRSSIESDLYYQSLYHRVGLSLSTRSILPGTSFSTIEKSSSRSLGAFWNYDNTRGDLIPISGTGLRAAYDYVLSKAADYGNLELSIRQHLPLKGRFIAYLAAAYRSSENKHLPEYDLYTMGGFQSLRGYREDEFRSRKLGWVNTELRYMIAANTMLYAFYDQGFITQADNSSKYDLIGIGGGIKLGTRLGILSIEYGLGYRDKSFGSLGSGMIHLGLDIAL